MGAWGCDPLANDTAMDWLGQLCDMITQEIEHALAGTGEWRKGESRTQPSVEVALAGMATLLELHENMGTAALPDLATVDRWESMVAELDTHMGWRDVGERAKEMVDFFGRLRKECAELYGQTLIAEAQMIIIPGKITPTA